MPYYSTLLWKTQRKLYAGWLRLSHWEYWPAWIIYTPVFMYLLYLAYKYKHPCLFTNANPAIASSGFAFESKVSILDLLCTNPIEAKKVAAYTGLFGNQGDKFLTLKQWMGSNQLDYPVVLKPNQGERGRAVEIIHTDKQAQHYLNQYEEDIIAQRYIKGFEFGVFYLRYPNETQGRILSLAQKHPQFVYGDAKHSLEELILSDKRAVAMFKHYQKHFANSLKSVPQKAQPIALTEIGSHSRGAMFTDARHLITEAMQISIDQLSRSFVGFHIGRYDIKVSNIDAFCQGKGIQVLELNGITAEPAHIYHPNFSLFSAIKTLCAQWQAAVECGWQNLQHNPNAQVMTLKQLYLLIKRYRESKKS